VRIVRETGKSLAQVARDGEERIMSDRATRARVSGPLGPYADGFADQPPAPPPIRNALRTIDIHVTETIDQARLLPKAA
jgi:hypothetical protein